MTEPYSTTSAPDLLRAAADLIDERAAQRDVESERSMAKTVTAFNTLTGHTLSVADGWRFMVVLKLARDVAGRFQPDDLLDGAAYMALALETRLAELTVPETRKRQQCACNG